MLITEETQAIDFLQSNLPENQFQLLGQYRDILIEHNKSLNLISKHTMGQIWQRHILDSYQLISHIDKDDIVTDIGSGAGFPGIVLTILGVEKIKMIDSINKKVIFINQVLNQLGFSKKAIHSRIEDFRLKPDIITARALKPLTEIFDLIDSHLVVQKKILLLKGAKTEEEIREAKKLWSFEYKLHQSITSSESFIIEIAPGYKKKSAES